MTRLYRLGIVSLIAFSGCGFAAGPGEFDYDTPLCGGYHLFRLSAHQVAIRRPTSQHDTPAIPAKVTAIAWDSKFILAQRQVMRRRSTRPDDTYEVPVVDTVDYWIIDTSTDSLYGPMSIEEFTRRRSAVGVPASMQLRQVSHQANWVFYSVIVAIALVVALFCLTLGTSLRRTARNRRVDASE